MKLALKCSHLLSSSFKILDSIMLVIYLLQALYRRYYYWLSQLYIPCSSLYQTLVLALITFRLLFSLWSPAPTITRKKHHKFSILWAVQACKCVHPWDEQLETSQKTWPWAFDFTLFWFECYWANFSYLVCSYKA